jgi:hypothetical protein
MALLQFSFCQYGVPLLPKCLHRWPSTYKVGYGARRILPAEGSAGAGEGLRQGQLRTTDVPHRRNFPGEAEHRLAVRKAQVRRCEIDSRRQRIHEFPWQKSTFDPEDFAARLLLDPQTHAPRYVKSIELNKATVYRLGPKATVTCICLLVGSHCAATSAISPLIEQCK